ncbi:MAG: hypothetical protein ACREMQ_23220 [Longimicrobiales bacterium]
MPRDGATLVVILLFALALRLPGFTEGLWYDELYANKALLARCAPTHGSGRRSSERGGPDEIIYARDPADSIVAGVLARTRRQHFFVLDNRFDQSAFTAMFTAAYGSVVRDPRYRLVARRAFKGVNVLEYQVQVSQRAERRGATLGT